MNVLQSADVAPTANQRAAIAAARQGVATAMTRWNALKAELPAINALLEESRLDRITVPPDR
jgi:hypothetical protein